MVYIVNGKEVEYLHVDKKINGDIVVEYDEKFNLITAHTGTIMEKVRNNGLDCHIFKELKHNIIEIWLYDMHDINGILYSLGVPHGCYEVLHDDKIVVIDTPIYEELCGF